MTTNFKLTGLKEYNVLHVDGKFVELGENEECLMVKTIKVIEGACEIQELPKIKTIYGAKILSNAKDEHA